MPSPRVSVIIPTYNRAALLPRAVNSVLAQSFQDFELLIVDDCSADDTPQVIAAFADPRIRAFRHDPNRGLSAALNTGIANARGEFCALLEDDDELTPDSIADRLAAFDAGPPELAMVYGFMDLVYDDTGERTTGHRFALEGAEAFEFSLTSEAFAGLQVMMVRTSAAKDIGSFDERLSMGLDGLFQCRILSKYPIHVVRKVVALKHQHHSHIQLSNWRYHHRILDHLVIHIREFSAEIDRRPGLRDHLSRKLPAHWMRTKAIDAAREAAIFAALRAAARAFTIEPRSSKTLRLPLHVVKGLLFYASPLRRFRRPLQRLAGQRV